MNYKNEYRASTESSEAFWMEKANAISWFTPPPQACSKATNGYYDWFKGGKLNTSYLALDHHVKAGRGDKTALIYDSPVTNTVAHFTYQELLIEVASFAGVLAKLGVSKGDRVIIYMPMIPQAAIAMLACARIGAIHSVVFGGFAANELAVRIDDATPTLIVTASCGIEGKKLLPYKPLVDEAVAQATHKPTGCVVFQRPQLRADLNADFDHDWQALVSSSSPIDAVELDATDPLYVLYTSGTTGKPKGVLRDNGGHAVALHYSMGAIYGIDQDDVFWAASDVGWVVGHSYIVYGPLIKGATSVMYEGKPVGTPDAGAFWRMIDNHKINVLFAAPTAFRAIRKEDPEANLLNQYDISSLRTLFMAGERLDPPTYYWANEKVGVPVIDHWWQTETGWPICSNPMGIEAMTPKPGSSSVPTPGFSVKVLQSGGEEQTVGEKGAIAIRLPLPPGCLMTIWQDHERFVDGYLREFEGYYSTGDNGYIDEDGYVFIMGRTDDVINVAGHRLSTGEIEEVLAGHPAIAECSVIGIQDSLKGQLPVGLVLLKDGVSVDEGELEQALISRVRETIGPVACFKRAIVVKQLPKTRSGKILRKLLRQIAANETVSVPSTIDDPGSVTDITALMREKGLVADTQPAS
ncbi:propionyl-CoA synthetase [Alteromonas sp. D210916BOD_24]|uniref:propionyl-CoA synthetase n=1 Tax=Alteromonas sp. D210916BOD_24 TaxID=3157618 RepID=UPI00399CB2C0